MKLKKKLRKAVKKLINCGKKQKLFLNYQPTIVLSHNLKYKQIQVKFKYQNNKIILLQIIHKFK